MLTRRMFVADMAVALAAAGCSRSDRTADNAPEVPATGVSATPRRGPLLKLLANHHPNLCNVGSRVARERGFFAAEGLDVDLLPVEFTAGHVHSGEWVAGPNGRVQADMIFVEYPALVDLASGKLDYKVVGGEHSGCKQLVVPARSSIRTLADLKGRRIGLPSIGGDRLIWEYLARQGGVASDSIRWIPVDVPLGGSEELEFVTREFEAGRLDSYATSDPVGEILVSNGVAARLASNTWTAPLNGWYCCMIALRRQLLDARPEVAGAVMRAYRQSAAFIEQHPMDAVTLSVEAGYMPRDTPRDLCARLLREYVWTATGRIEDDLERYFQLLIEAGRMPWSASPRELVARVYQGAEA
jgi:NitT/TauT family transport system substrate-binding protein